MMIDARKSRYIAAAIIAASIFISVMVGAIIIAHNMPDTPQPTTVDTVSPYELPASTVTKLNNGAGTIYYLDGGSSAMIHVNIADKVYQENGTLRIYKSGTGNIMLPLCNIVRIDFA